MVTGRPVSSLGGPRYQLPEPVTMLWCVWDVVGFRTVAVAVRVGDLTVGADVVDTVVVRVGGERQGVRVIGQDLQELRSLWRTL